MHDVSPRFESQIDQLTELLASRIGSLRIAMLVVPDHWGDCRIDQHPGFAARLRGWADAGVEMFLHGWFHRDTVNHARVAARAKARWMTAGEGEFLGLSRGDAAARMAAGRDMVEGITGRRVAGFIAPAWLYGDGARQAMRDLEFALAEDHRRVWRPADGRVVARGPVVTWASRSAVRTASSLAVAALARSALRHSSVVRVAVHPGDTSKPAILTSIDRTISHFARTHQAGSYAALLAGHPPPPAAHG